MKNQNIIIAHPNTDEQASVLKAFMEALKIKFEISKNVEKNYNPEFIKKIRKSKKEFKEGKFKRVKKEDLKNFLSLE